MPPTIINRVSTENPDTILDQDPTRVATSFRGTGWLEFLASFLAIAGVIGSVLSGYHAREWQASASDFKTVYASAQCLRHHIDAYDFHNIAAVFQANHVVPPVSWYAHAPVYPPFTLAILAPLTVLPMVPAIFVWMALSGVALALAAFLLASAAGDFFQLALPWRLALIALFAASPLLSFSLEMGNVSAIAASLCIAAVILSQASPQLRAVPPIALAAALLLKPHLALWVVLAFLISRSRESRRLAVASVMLFGVALLAIGLWMAAHHRFAPEIASYRVIVQQEVAGGSMDPTKIEIIAVAAQITSLASLLGYWLTGLPLNVANAALLTALFGTLTYLSLKIETKAFDSTSIQVAVWSTFGLLASYHRAHDSLILLILLPGLLWRMSKNRKDPVSLFLVGLLFFVGSGPSAEAYSSLASQHGLAHIATFLLFRQSAVVATLFVLILIAVTVRQTAKQRMVLPQQVRARGLYGF